MNSRIDMKTKMRTVNVNQRGQLVIPEDIRKDLGIGGGTTLVLIKRQGEILLRKEAEVLKTIAEDNLWRELSRKAMKNAWGAEDEVWDKFAKNLKRPRP